MSSTVARRPDRHRATAIVLGVVVLVAGLAMVLILSTGPTRPPVALIGDSITLLTSGSMKARLGGDYALKIDANNGYRIEQQMGAAEAEVARDNKQVVINLGTNDVINLDQDLDQSVASLDAMVALFPHVACIHLVTINDQMRNEAISDAEVLARATTINDAIRALAAEDPRITVIDWNQEVHDYEAAHDGQTPTIDTIHPDADGTELLVGQYQAALAACPT